MDISALDCEPIPITSLQMLRNEIVYVHRNGYVVNSAFTPFSYPWRIVEGERMFRDAHQYFNLLSKNYEAYSEEARRLGDIVVLTDEEMYPAVRMECRRRFGARKYSELDLKDKVSLAKVMHEDYSASNSQIQRILNIDIHTVNSLFPLRNH